MSRGIYVALSGAVAQETALETTATNLANASTPGYQRLRPVFREALSNATQQKPGAAMRSVSLDATAIDTTRGALQTTGRPLDVALPEGVFLGATTPRGERYTRGGALKVAADGSLTTASGAKLVREDGAAITLDPKRETSITSDGSVVQDGATVARLRLVKIEGGKLEHEGGGLLVARGGAPVAAGGPIDVGALEESNASVVGSMTELVSASRTFEAFQRMLETFGEIDRKVLSTVPTPTEG